MFLFCSAGIVLDIVNGNGKINPSALRILRVFRIARLLKFLDFAKGVRQLVVALVISLPSLFNVATLIFIIVFIYAIIGMSLFGNIKHQGSINDMENFENFGKSMLLLFRLTTAAGWNDILDSLSVAPPDCDPLLENIPYQECGRQLVATAYLVSYVLFIYLIMINMYIAILLESVSSVHHEEDFLIRKETIDNFYNVWNSFATEGGTTIPYSKLSDFAAKLMKPLKIPQPNNMKIFRMRIPLRKGNQVHVFDVMKAMVKKTLEKEGKLESPEKFDEIVTRMEVSFIGRKRTANYVKSKPSSKEAAVIALQKAYRTHLMRKRLQEVVETAQRLTNAFANPCGSQWDIGPQSSNQNHLNETNSKEDSKNVQMCTIQVHDQSYFGMVSKKDAFSTETSDAVEDTRL